jgi:hypothetical protein
MEVAASVFVVTQNIDASGRKKMPNLRSFFDLLNLLYVTSRQPAGREAAIRKEG